MLAIGRLQAALRGVARLRYEALSIPPFTLFFHPSDPLPYFNYAIPDEPVSAGLAPALRAVREAFKKRGLRARFEFIEAFAPGLAPALSAARFIEEDRQRLLVCARGRELAIAPPEGIAVSSLAERATPGDVWDLVATQRRGFDPADSRPATETDVERLLEELGRGAIGFLARIEGEPVGAAITTEPLNGLTELCGICTLEPFRRRGVATSLAAAAVRKAFERGIESVFLTAADETSGRVTSRVGFLPYAVMLSYGDPQPR